MIEYLATMIYLGKIYLYEINEVNKQTLLDVAYENTKLQLS